MKSGRIWSVYGYFKRADQTAWTLEKQSETARIYLAKREELKELDVNLFLLDHQRTGELLKELEEKLEQAQRELNEAQAAYDQTKIEYDRLEQELEDLNQQAPIR